MRKIGTIMIALAMAFAFVVPAMADEICEPCTKCVPSTIACPEEQEGDPCPYEDDYDIYTGTDCPVVFSICECDDPSQFKADDVVGITMKILVNGEAGDNGAYFLEEFSGLVNLSRNKNDACDLITTAPNNRASSFGVATYDYYSATGSVTPGWAGNCPPDADDKVIRFSSQTGSGMTILAEDEVNKRSHWAIDIPAIVVTTAISECSTISVEIGLMTEATGGICGECAVACSCVYDLYRVCCPVGTTSWLFPYFTSLGDADAYWNGIVIDNLSSQEGTVTLTAYEKDGSVGTFTTDVIPAHSMFVDLLENIAWSGDGLGNAPCYIIAKSTFVSDGFAMMADKTTHDSMGYLPRSYCPGD